MRWCFAPPLADADRVLRCGLRLHVCRKARRHARWEKISPEIDMEDTQRFLEHLPFEEGVEIGVFFGGSIYWTSKYPDVHNSSMVRARGYS